MLDNSMTDEDIVRLVRYPLLSKEEETDLPALIAQGDEVAFRRYLEGNLRLVVKWAVAACRTNPQFELADAVSEGAIGLMKAIRKFDPAKGFAFSTCASWWIRADIQTAIAARGRLVRVPMPVLADLRVLGRVMRDRGLSLDDLRSERGCRLGCDLMGWTADHLIDRAVWMQMPASLDARSGGSDDGIDAYGIGVGAVELDDKWVGSRDVMDTLRALLRPEDAAIVALRFGLDGAGERKWRVVADLVGMGTAAVEARASKALKKLAAEHSEQMREVLSYG